MHRIKNEYIVTIQKVIYLIKANHRQIIEMYVKKLLNRSNRITVCSPFIPCSVCKYKTAENGEKQQKFLFCKNDKDHSADKNNGHRLKSTCTLHHDLVAVFFARTEKRSLVLTRLLGISFFQGI